MRPCQLCPGDEFAGSNDDCFLGHSFCPFRSTLGEEEVTLSVEQVITPMVRKGIVQDLKGFDLFIWPLSVKSS